MLYENTTDNIQPFTILEKTAHIFQLLSENMKFLPDYDKNEDHILALTAMIGYIQKILQIKFFLKIFPQQEIAAKPNAQLSFKSI